MFIYKFIFWSESSADDTDAGRGATPDDTDAGRGATPDVSSQYKKDVIKPGKILLYPVVIFSMCS